MNFIKLWLINALKMTLSVSRLRLKVKDIVLLVMTIKILVFKKKLNVLNHKKF